MGNYKIHTGHIKDSVVAIGPKSTAIGGSQYGETSAHDVLAELDKLAELIAAHQDEATDAGYLQQSAIAAREELIKKRPDLSSVRSLLERIAGGVVKGGILADAVMKIQALLAHISF
jgi:hypothetical protein